MAVYAVLVLVFFASYFVFRTYYSSEKTTRYMITTFFVGYIILLCFRDPSVGIDTNNYITKYFIPFQFMNWKDILHYTIDEPGFSVLVKLIHSITNSQQVFIAVIALLSVIPVMILYRKESKEAAVCCSFFMISLLFEIFFSGIRQGIAIGLTVPAYYFTKNRKIIPFLLIVLLATSFHISAVMILAIYPIYYAKITGKWLWFVLPSIALVYFYKSTIFTVMFQVFGGKYFEKYSTLYGSTNQYGLLLLFMMLSVYALIVLDEHSADDNDIGLRNILFLATLIQCFAPLHEIVSRMNYYYILFIPLAIVSVNYKCKRKYTQVTKLASAIMTVYFIFYFFFLKGDTLHIMEYKFFF